MNIDSKSDNYQRIKSGLPGVIEMAAAKSDPPKKDDDNMVKFGELLEKYKKRTERKRPYTI